jgi:cation:H+ antiporter
MASADRQTVAGARGAALASQQIGERRRPRIGAAPIILLTAALEVPAMVMRLGGIHIGTVVDTAIFGLAIVSAAFILAWAAEAAEVEISQALAVAFIALIAVLPEYAVDMTFAWKAGQDPEYAPYAVANMTGGNRLLIGLGWSFVFFLFWYRTRGKLLRLERGHSIDVIALGAATAYSLTIPFKGSISLVDTAVLAAIFVVYVIIIARLESEEPELVGPARAVGTLPRTQRRIALLAMFLFAAVGIFLAAEPFAEGLIHTGTELGIDEFLLVQWLAPLASEAPEFLVAGILAYRGRATVAMGALLSSKVNQWTLLIGGLPVAYSASSGALDSLPLDSRQQHEVWLTAGQSAFAVAVLVSLSLEAREAIALLGLFLIQFFIPIDGVHLAMTYVYLVLAIGIFLLNRRDIRALFAGARAELRELAEARARAREEVRAPPG